MARADGEGDRISRLALVLLLWAAGLGAAGQFAKMALILPELAALHPGRGAAVGFLVSSIGLVGAVLGLVAGLAAGRFGPRRLLLGSLALGAAVSLVQATLPPFPVMLASRLVEGLSHLGVVVAAPTLIAAAAGPRHRPLAMTLWGTFFGVAFAITAWAGTPLVAAHGPAALLLAHGAVMAGLAAAIALAGPPDAPAAARPSLGAREVLGRHLAAYGSPSVAAPALGWVFYTLTFVALLAVLPGLVPPGSRTFVAAAMPLASIAVSMTLGVAMLRVLGAVGVVATGFAAAIGLAAAVLAVPGEPWLCIALFGALGLVQGATFAAIPELNPDPGAQALANGAVAQMGNLGNLLGTPLILFALGAGGPGAMLALVMACHALGLAAHALAARRRRAGARDAA